MTQGLIRLHHSGQSHFLTFSCYHRLPKMNTDARCSAFLTALERVRKEFSLRVHGYVVMPEHIHLLVSEPECGELADAVHLLKLSSAKNMPELDVIGHFWQKRYYARNIRSYSDFAEKLRYIHRNPVKRGLCGKPEDWVWSSFRHYAVGDTGAVEIESEWTARRREGLSLSGQLQNRKL